MINDLESKVSRMERIMRRRLRLENRAMFERTMGPGGDSKAFKLWKYLRDNGAKTAAQIRSALPEISTSGLQRFLDGSLIALNGTQYSANLDYNWDDAGVLPRITMADIQNAVADDATGDAEEVTVAPTRSRGRSSASAETPAETAAPTRSRRSAARAVRANIWSSKIEEVQAAIDAGEDVNVKDDKNRKPLEKILSSNKDSRLEIAKLLLDHDAVVGNLNHGGQSLLNWLIPKEDYDAVNLLIDYRVPVDNTNIYSIAYMHDRSKALSIFIKIIQKYDPPALRAIISNLVYYSIYYLSRPENSTLMSQLLDAAVAVLPSLSAHGLNSLFAKVIAYSMKCEAERLHSLKLMELGLQYDIWALPADYKVALTHSVLSNIPNQILQRVYQTIRSKYNQITAFNRMNLTSTARAIANYLHQPTDFLDNGARDFPYQTMPAKELTILIKDSITTGDVGILSGILATDCHNVDKEILLRDSYDREPILFALLRTTDKQVTRVALKIILKAKVNLTTSLPYNAGYEIMTSKNAYMLEWLMDRYESFMMRLLQERCKITNDSPELIKQLYIAHGGRINSATNYDLTGGDVYDATKGDKEEFIELLKEKLEEDGRVDDLRNFIRQHRAKHPKIMSDPDVVEAIYDSEFDDSILARQLRREVKQPDAPKYNF